MPENGISVNVLKSIGWYILPKLCINGEKVEIVQVYMNGMKGLIGFLAHMWMLHKIKLCYPVLKV